MEQKQTLNYNLVGISGKIGSGKDEVGKILQYLHSDSYLKYDVTYEQYLDLVVQPDVNSKWKIKKFAYKVKQIVSTLTGIPIEDLEKEEIKNSYLGEEWDRFFVITPQKFENPIVEECDSLSEVYAFGKIDMNSKLEIRRYTVRDLFIKIGNGLRESIHKDIWVKGLFSNYTSDQKWLITDLRYKNEYKKIKENKGICIRINRPDNKNTPINNPSETELDNHEFDYYITNDGDINDLVEKIKQLIKDINE